MSATTPLALGEIRELAMRCLTRNGADEANAAPLADTLAAAERDGSHSHGLFRLPAYVAALRSGKSRGDARPVAERVAPSVVRLRGDNCFAPHAHRVGIPPLVEAARETGAAVLSMTAVHHMAALWPEVEAVAAHNLAALACTSYLPAVAPAGARRALFGTNPLAFAWPRPGRDPAVFDMATASMAMGEVMVAARDGREVPPGTGLDRDGNPATDPARIVDGGVLLPFGGHKGSALSMMVELLAGGLTGDNFSFEAKESDNGDGGPPQGGQLLVALSPDVIAGPGWERHCAAFLDRLEGLDGVRLPGARRHRNRLSDAPREIDSALLGKIRALADGPAGAQGAPV